VRNDKSPSKKNETDESGHPDRFPGFLKLLLIFLLPLNNIFLDSRRDGRPSTNIKFLALPLTKVSGFWRSDPHASHEG
jgi:hypothetical protein